MRKSIGQRVTILILLAAMASVLASCGRPSNDQQTISNNNEGIESTIVISGKIAQLSSLDMSEFEVFGNTEDAYKINSGGEFDVGVSSIVPVILFAGPKDNSSAAAELGEENGLLMAPYFGNGFRLGSPNGLDYIIDNQSDILLTGYSSIVSLLLMHPALAHPGVDEQREIAEQILGLSNLGEINIRAAGRLWEQAIEENRAFDEDADLSAALEQILDVIFEHLEVTEDDFYQRDDLTQRQNPLGRPYYAVGRGGIEVSTLEIEQEEFKLVFDPGTATGTALDYLYFVHPLVPERFGDWPHSTTIGPVDIMRVYQRSGGQFASGIADASSYWSYLDVLGNTMNWVTSAIGGVTLERDAKLSFPIPDSGTQFYEIRFYSGGLGYGNDEALYYHVNQHYYDESMAAAIYNISMAMLEVLSLIPGADALIGDSTGRQLLKTASTQVFQEATRLMTTTGNLSGGDFYDILYSATKSVVDSYLDEASKRTRRRGFIRLVSWVGYGSRKAVRMLESAPKAVATGGSLTNRAFRFVRPDSIVEAYIVGITRMDDHRVPFSAYAERAIEPNQNYSGDPIEWMATLRGSIDMPDKTRYEAKQRYPSDLHLAIAMETDGQINIEFIYHIDFYALSPWEWYVDVEENPSMKPSTITTTFGAIEMIVNTLYDEQDLKVEDFIEVEHTATGLKLTGTFNFDSTTDFDHHRVGSTLWNIDFRIPYTRVTLTEGEEPVEKSDYYHLGRFDSILWWDPHQAQDIGNQ